MRDVCDDWGRDVRRTIGTMWITFLAHVHFIYNGV